MPAQESEKKWEEFLTSLYRVKEGLAEFIMPLTSQKHASWADKWEEIYPTDLDDVLVFFMLKDTLWRKDDKDYGCHREKVQGSKKKDKAF